MPDFQDDATARRRGTRHAFAWRLAAPLALVIATTGCSQVPDALNPVEWYRGAADMLSGEEETASTEPAPAPGTLAAERGQPAPGADAPFPNLASVPERPAVDSAETRRQIAEGLVADRQQARHSSEVIRRQGGDEAVAAAAPPPLPAIPTAAPVAPTPAQPARVPEPVAAAPAAPAVPPAVPPAAAAPPREAVPAAPAPPQPQPARLAALSPPPPPAARAVPAPGASSGNSVGDVFRNRLAEQNRLPSQLASAGGGDGAGVGGSAADFSTVVVSSGGVIVPGTPNVSGLGSGQPNPPAAGLPGQAAPGALPSYGAVKVATIIFANGSARLSSQDRRILADVTALYRQRGGVVHVVGHASSRTRAMDPQRHQAVNVRMSAQRADAVASALAGMGVPREAIRIDARADAEPLYYEVMPTGEAGNRRAEIYLES